MHRGASETLVEPGVYQLESPVGRDIWSLDPAIGARGASEAWPGRRIRGDNIMDEREIMGREGVASGLG